MELNIKTLNSKWIKVCTPSSLRFLVLPINVSDQDTLSNVELPTRIAKKTSKVLPKASRLSPIITTTTSTHFSPNRLQSIRPRYLLHTSSL